MKDLFIEYFFDLQTTSLGKENVFGTLGKFCWIDGMIVWLCGSCDLSWILLCCVLRLMTTFYKSWYAENYNDRMFYLEKLVSAKYSFLAIVSLNRWNWVLQNRKDTIYPTTPTINFNTRNTGKADSTVNVLSHFWNVFVEIRTDHEVNFSPRNTKLKSFRTVKEKLFWVSRARKPNKGYNLEWMIELDIAVNVDTWCYVTLMMLTC